MQIVGDNGTVVLTQAPHPWRAGVLRWAVAGHGIYTVVVDQLTTMGCLPFQHPHALPSLGRSSVSDLGELADALNHHSASQTEISPPCSPAVDVPPPRYWSPPPNNVRSLSPHGHHNSHMHRCSQ